MDLYVGTEDMYAWSSVRSSVRSFYKLYDSLFASSTKNESFFSTFDPQLNVIMISTINISTIILRTDGSSTRVARTEPHILKRYFI